VLASGLTDLGVGFAAALHFFAGQRLSLPAELNGPELVSQLYVDGLEFVDGAVSVPTGPGLGIAVDEGAIRADTVRCFVARRAGSHRQPGTLSGTPAMGIRHRH